MADPILPGSIRAQVIFKGPSGLPEDVYVNSFVFNLSTTTEPTATLYETIANDLRDFYDIAHAPAGNPIKLFFPAFLANQVEMKFYWLGQAPPREPFLQTRLITTDGSSQALPSEVALCASYYADRNLPRQRGRIYIGPFTVGALSGGAGAPAIPVSGLIDAVRWSSQWLANQGGTSYVWSILSGADGVSRGITNGWVDNAFDTQRRRGEEASTRSTWQAALV
jgi:hypothetical protein